MLAIKLLHLLSFTFYNSRYFNTDQLTFSCATKRSMLSLIFGPFSFKHFHILRVYQTFLSSDTAKCCIRIACYLFIPLHSMHLSVYVYSIDKMVKVKENACLWNEIYLDFIELKVLFQKDLGWSLILYKHFATNPKAKLPPSV